MTDKWVDLPEGFKMSADNWSELNPIEKEKARAHPWHTIALDKTAREIQNKLKADREIMRNVEQKYEPLEATRKIIVFSLVWLIYQKFHAVVSLCWENHSNGAFLICRQMLEEYVDVKLLLDDQESRQVKTIGYAAGIWEWLASHINTLKRKQYSHNRPMYVTLDKDEQRARKESDRLIQEYTPECNAEQVKEWWPHKPIERFIKSKLQNLYPYYSYLSMKSHSSFLNIRQRMSKSSTEWNTRIFDPEPDMTREVAGFAYDIIYRTLNLYFEYMKRSEAYDYPESLLQRIENIYKRTNMGNIQKCANEEFKHLGLVGVAVLFETH